MTSPRNMMKNMAQQMNARATVPVLRCRRRVHVFTCLSTLDACFALQLARLPLSRPHRSMRPSSSPSSWSLRATTRGTARFMTCPSPRSSSDTTRQLLTFLQVRLDHAAKRVCAAPRTCEEGRRHVLLTTTAEATLRHQLSGAAEPRRTEHEAAEEADKAHDECPGHDEPVPA